MPITADEYQQACLRTEVTEPFLKGDHQLSRLLHALMGLTTEAAEAMDVLKKHLVYNKPLDRIHLLEEIQDTLWYCAIALDSLDSTFSEAFEGNIRKLSVRYKNKFTQEQALVRDLPAERAALEGK